MRSTSSFPSASVSDSDSDSSANSDNEKNTPPRRIYPFYVESEDKNLDLLIKALVKGKHKTYFEKVSLAFKSAFLTLPAFFMNGSFIFFGTQARLEASMRDNIYYNHYFSKFIKIFSYEGAIVSSEAAAITTPSVLLAILVLTSSLLYQASKYYSAQEEMKDLITFLKEKNYPDTAKLRSYHLTPRQCEYIRLLFECDGLDESSVIQSYPSWHNQFASDLLWVNEEADKYIAPLLLLSLVPGFVLMFRTAKEIDNDMNCSMFSLWALFFNVCPPIKKIEIMSLLTYIWGCFSGTLLATHSIAIISRVGLTPLPALRLWFDEKINQPFSQWWGADQLYDKLIGKVLLSTLMPLIAGYSLYSAIQFTNQYLGGTGCLDIKHALAKVGSQGSAYPCSTTEVALGASTFIGELEFNHLYPAYMSIEALTSLLAFAIKRLPYFKQESMLEKVKTKLAKFTPLEHKMAVAVAVGAVAGGLLGIWPSIQVSNNLLQKEGFELFYPLNNLSLLRNFSLPDSLSDLPLSLEDLLANTPACSIESAIHLPDTTVGNVTFPSVNASFPCLETFFDPKTNSTILGVQLTPPCPNQSIYSIFYRNLFHLPINCDPILVVRAFAGFVVPYWVSVNTGAAISSTLAATLLLAVWAMHSLRPTPEVLPDLVAANQVRGREQRGNYSPRLFANPVERSSLNLQALRDTQAANNEYSDDSDDEIDNPSTLQPNCWSRLKNRISGLFQPAPRQERGSRNPLLPRIGRNFSQA